MILACAPSALAAQDTGFLVWKALDCAAREALAGVRVLAAAQEGTPPLTVEVYTRPDGGVLIELPEGTYVVRATRTAYGEVVDTVRVERGMDVERTARSPRMFFPIPRQPEPEPNCLHFSECIFFLVDAADGERPLLRVSE